MLAVLPAPAFKLDIGSIVERSPAVDPARSPRSPGNASTLSSRSRESRYSSIDGNAISIPASSVTTAGSTSTPTRLPSIANQHLLHPAPPTERPQSSVQTEYQIAPYAPGQPSFNPHNNHPAYHPYQQPTSAPDLRLPPIPITHAYSNHKRVASPHPAETPAKKKQSKWTSIEDALIIQLRGNGMKWEDISKRLPGRSAISCRLRFQNYLERRGEWDEEMKNKLARLYDRFKQEMWEKIAKEMQIPWRAAEAMHWNIGSEDMAARANVPVFHLAGQQQSSASTMDRGHSLSPPSKPPPGPLYHPQTHNMVHAPPPPPASFTYIQTPGAPPQFPAHIRRNSVGPPLPFPTSRPRADSARSLSAYPTSTLPPLQPINEQAGHKFNLPPLMASSPPGR